MVDLRIGNLDAMTARLRAAGIAIDVDPQHYPSSFARLHDPEGNPIERGSRRGETLRVRLPPKRNSSGYGRDDWSQTSGD